MPPSSFSQPDAGARQPVGRADVVHQKPVDVPDGRFFVEIGGQQFGMARLGAAVAADVQVIAVLGGDQADVLGLSLGTFAHAARDGHFDLVRRANPLVAVLDADGESDRVLHAVAAPGVPTQLLTVRRALPYAWPLSKPASTNCSQMSGKSCTCAPNRSMRWPPVIFVYRPYCLATEPKTISLSGVISPPGTRGTTQYNPPRCILARKRSFVSCSVWCSGSACRRSTGWPGSRPRPACTFRSRFLGRSRPARRQTFSVA